MEKKLPGVFANRINKNLENNDKVFYSQESIKETNEVKEKKNIKNIPVNLDGKNISQKINAIFNSPRYVYKADVEIKLKDKSMKTKIIGQNPTHLITINNELIPIGDILDINYVE